MKKAENCIGKPACQWPRSNACVQREEYKAIADVIWKLDAVKAWVFEAADADERDCRACSLTTATTNALRNARQPWETPQAHRNRYVKLAERLDAASRYRSGGKRMDKLRSDLESEKVLLVRHAAVTAPTHGGPTGRRPGKAHKLGNVAAAIIRAAEKTGLADTPISDGQSDTGDVAPVYWPPLAELASSARVFAKAGGDPEAADDAEAAHDPNWTQPKPKHDHAARNIVIFELDDFQRNNYGRSSHAMTAAIVNAFFKANDWDNPTSELNRLTREVETLTRARRKRLRQ